MAHALEATPSEKREIYPILRGKSVLIVDEGNMREKHFQELRVRQGMGVTPYRIDMINGDLPELVKDLEYDSVAIHLPGTDNQETIELYERTFEGVVAVCKRTLLLTAVPANDPSIALETRLKEKYAYAPKWQSEMVSQKLAELFTQYPVGKT